ncbi:MAG TPA: glycine zipper 2TM domain-containing protein [Allosphingosinicella sp.]|nr:glycine zipper 2TM domain-containing protein [Allosphingosinicella sp.]
MRNVVLGLAAVTMAVPALPAAAVAQSRYDGYRYARNYDRGAYQGRTWRGRDGRIYCRRSNGTTGLIVGGAAGALIGREIDGGRSRTAGTILGAALGAVLGREVQRGGSRRRCR